MKRKAVSQLNEVTGLAIGKPRAVPEGGKALTALAGRFLLACLGSGCAVLVFVTAFALPVNPSVITGALCLMIALLTGVFHLRRISVPLLLLLGVIWVFMGWKFRAEAVLGLLKTASLMLELFTSHSTWTFLDLGADIADMLQADAARRVTLFLLLALFPWTAMFTRVVMRGHGFLLSFLLTVPFAAVPLWFYIRPAPAALMGLFLFWCAMAFARLFPRRDRGAVGRAAFLLLPALALLMLVLGLLIPAESYQRSVKAEEARVKAETWLKSLPALLTTDSGSPVPAVSSGGFLDHDQRRRSFDNLGSARFSGQTALRVKAVGGGGGAMYLKGYTGGVYTSGGWEQLGNEAYAALAEACAPVDPQNLKAYGQGESAEYGTITVINQANKKAVYVPNGLVTTPDQFALAEFVGDGNIRAGGLLGLDEYTVKYLLEESSQAQDIYLPSVELLERYEEAVYRYYTDVSEALRPTLDSVLEQVKRDGDHVSAPTMAQAVTALLGKQAAYTLTPGSPPKGRDFTDYFLTENKRGFCVHFATAGVLLMRQLGIPARYCEGYLVTPTDLRLKGSDGFSNVPDRRAHAWAEYWQTGIGWVTMECTPGFNPQSDVVQPNDVANETVSTPEPTEKPETTPAPKPTPGAEPTPAPEDATEKEERPTQEAVLSVLKVVVWPLLVAVAVEMRRRILLNLRQKAVQRSDRNGAALVVYTASERLTPYVGEQSRDVTTLAEKARFSQHMLSQEELGLLTEDWRSREKEALRKAGLGRKLWLIWGLCLKTEERK